LKLRSNSGCWSLSCAGSSIEDELAPLEQQIEDTGVLLDSTAIAVFEKSRASENFCMAQKMPCGYIWIMLTKCENYRNASCTNRDALKGKHSYGIMRKAVRGRPPAPVRETLQQADLEVPLPCRTMLAILVALKSTLSWHQRQSDKTC